MSLLEVRDLTVVYGRAAVALEGVALQVGAGERVALLGPNGAGKTTTLRACGGLLAFHGGAVRRGEVRFDGEVVTTCPAHRLVAAGLAQTLEGRRVFTGLSVLDNLRSGAFAARGRADEHETLRGVLELFPELNERLHQSAGFLSGGEQQMLALGRALMARPRLLLLDEPSLGLAPLVVRRIGDALVRIAEQLGVALLLVDQSTALALRATKRAYLIEQGRITAGGETRALLGDDRVREAYLGESMTAAGRQLAAEAAP